MKSTGYLLMKYLQMSDSSCDRGPGMEVGDGVDSEDGSNIRLSVHQLQNISLHVAIAIAHNGHPLSMSVRPFRPSRRKYSKSAWSSRTSIVEDFMLMHITSSPRRSRNSSGSKSGATMSMPRFDSNMTKGTPSWCSCRC
jgi:hypothetical protein